MTDEHKEAIARVISDMIKADNIIEESEIRTMKELNEKYSITKEQIGASRGIRFSDAVNTLRELNKREREELIKDIYKIAVSDNICVPREALLQMALEYCLLTGDDNPEDDVSRPFLIPCPTGESTLNDQYMVYIENCYDSEKNEELQKNIRLFVTLSRLCGFHFIYIPMMVEEFRNMKKDFVMEVIRYMVPHKKENDIGNVYDRLCKMNTSDFCRDILKEQLQVNMPDDLPPSLLINIGTSVVPYCPTGGYIQYYTEFLCIPIKSDMLSLLDDVLDSYRSKLSTYQTVSMKSNKGHFKYFGFYKALFDFLIAPSPVAPDLIFIGQTTRNYYEVGFKFEDNTCNTMKLSENEYKIYKKIAERGVPTIERGILSSQDGVKPYIISRIRRKIREAVPNLIYSEQYKPFGNNGNYILNLDKNKMFRRVFQGNGFKNYEDVPIF